MTTDYVATKTFTAEPDVVFAALTTTQALSAWWVPATGSGLAGGELTFMHGTQSQCSRVDEARPVTPDLPGRVSWTVLTCEPLPDWVGTAIEFEITPGADGGCVMNFRHVGLTPQLECFDMCRQGWGQALAGLVSHVESHSESGGGSGRGAAAGSDVRDALERV